ncbi:MAG TPA: glycosyltransferase N-terminal domain-containing protein [Segetibacter sp.]|nr:glycosyltransferase N-terminal domain-containing protein [Segetibacter sp.]
MQRFLYHLFSGLYPFAIKLASPFNNKAKLWVKGRENVLKKMKSVIKREDQIIWMHCSSLGEFEQGRPILEKLKDHYTSYKILLTFFSPSGYEVRKNYTGADYIFYLPADSSKNARTFYDTINVKLIIFVKYEFWYYYLQEARKRNLPLLLISAIFRKEQPFFSRYGAFHRSMLSCFTHLFVQNEQSVLLLKRIGFNENVTLSGDTRFDRVIEIAEQAQSNLLIENFCANSSVIVAGSTWLEDDKELAHYVNTRSSIKFIIAPHNIDLSRLDECKTLYKKSIFYSSLNASTSTENINTIIVDNVGMLSSLYKYSTISYIGGGFGEDGVHNVLEAAVYGKPVVYGPEYEKFIEASELIECGGGVSINNALELESTFDHLLTNQADFDQRSQASAKYVYSKQGATEKILDFIYKNRLLTN